MTPEIFSSFRKDGSVNEYNGVSFTIIGIRTGYELDIIITELPQRKGAPLKVTITQEPNHDCPHVHVSIGHLHHIASVDLDGHFKKGASSLSRDEKRILVDWIQSHSITLQDLWDGMKKGSPDYTFQVKRVINTWETDGFVFDGCRPQNKRDFDGFTIWYNGSLTESLVGDQVEFKSSGIMCVVVKTKDKELISQYSFKSEESVQIKGSI